MPYTARIIIDFATGESWEVPIYLYERYVSESPQLIQNGKTVVEQWLASLPQEEKQLVQKQ